MEAEEAKRAIGCALKNQRHGDRQSHCMKRNGRMGSQPAKHGSLAGTAYFFYTACISSLSI
jgi:hypothetical protein